jgi:hypothetical protein
VRERGEIKTPAPTARVSGRQNHHLSSIASFARSIIFPITSPALAHGSIVSRLLPQALDFYSFPLKRDVKI